jgi:DNA polymerase-1
MGSYSNNARIELTRESLALEDRLKPITAELNEKPLRVNKLTWLVNTEAAEESANFLIDFCRYLADDDWFRPNSTADCVKALFTNRGFAPKKISKKTGSPLTDKDVLSELANGGDALAGTIIDARSAISRWGQLKAWRPFAEAGFVQSTWDSLGTPHGRYTSDAPCLNNRIIPIRETIEPDDGYSFLSFDLSQSEYVTWASLSGDLILGEAFLEGKDFHSEMARLVREAVPAWDLHGETERQAGKTLNFCILYLMQPHTLARKLGCQVEVASRIIGAYYKRAKAARRYIQRVLQRAKEVGYVETFYGRRRYCPEFQTANGDRESHEVAKTLWSHVNAGTAAEYLKFKQAKVWSALRQSGFTPDDVRLSIQMYDQLVWHCRDELLQEVRAITEEVWFEKERGFLPFKADVKIGKTWGECE